MKLCKKETNKLVLMMLVLLINIIFILLFLDETFTIKAITNIIFVINMIILINAGLKWIRCTESNKFKKL